MTKTGTQNNEFGLRGLIHQITSQQGLFCRKLYNLTFYARDKRRLALDEDVQSG